jgi:hypothetical protein
MKAEKQKLPQEPRFEPFQLSIRVESEEEAKALHAIFCHEDNTRLFVDYGNAITDALGNTYGVVGLDAVIANGVTCSQFFKDRL